MTSPVDDCMAHLKLLLKAKPNPLALLEQLRTLVRQLEAHQALADLEGPLAFYRNQLQQLNNHTRKVKP